MVPPPTLSGAEAEGDAAASAGFGCAETGAAGHTETGEGSSSLSGSSGFPWRSGPAQLGAGPAQLGAGPACVPVCASSAVGSPELGGACFGKGAEWSPKLCFPVPCGRLAMVWALSPISFYSRKLGTAGQKLGGAAVLCHIRHDPVDPGGPFTLTSANVGKCQTVLCRNGKPLPLSRSYVMSCEEELQRIKRHKAIVTEVRAVFLRLWGDWEEAAELAGEHLPRRSVDAKADPRFQIRIHSIRVDSCRIQNRAQSPLHVRAGQSPHPILGAPTGGSDLAASPRQGRAVTPSHPRGTHRGLGPGGLSASGRAVILAALQGACRGLRPCSLSASGWVVTPSHPQGTHRGLGPCGLSTSGRAVILAVPQGARSGAQAMWPLCVRLGSHPVLSSGHPQGAQARWTLRVWPGSHPVLSLGHPQGAQAQRPLCIRPGSHPVLSSGHP